jgi:DNA invertase Pin-like site-specific DNA recombinase
MKDAIGYRRVSTREQGRSGLGLAAQRDDIKRFAAHEGFTIRGWYQDIQTGAGKDALLLRPGLAHALKDARARRCPLIVSRLDRLSRNVLFITGLMEHTVHFMVAALGRDCDAFTLHIYASMAEQERKMISERIQAALAVRRRRGQVFGFALRSKAQQRRMRARARAALSRAARQRAEAYRVHIEWALRQPPAYRTTRPISFRAAANQLNARNLPSPMGGRWQGYQLMMMTRRLGLTHPRGHLLRAEARARVETLWNQHPDYTVKQIIAHLGPTRPLGTTRAERLLRDCRATAAQRSALHKQVGWPIDRRTTARIRIGQLWQRHPEFTAQQVLRTLGPGPFMTVPWVQRVMRECWRASRRHRGKEWLTGRRRYNTGRRRP